MTKFTLIHQATIAALASLAALTAQAATPAADHPAVQRALSQLKSQGAVAGHVSASDSFRARDLVADADGSQHVRFTRQYRGLPVIGGDLVVHLSPSGQLQDLSISQTARIALDVKPQLSSRDAGAKALAAFPHRDGRLDSLRLVVYARDTHPQLAWDALVKGVQADGTPSEHHVILGAGGKVLDRWDDIHTGDDVGQGRTLYAGNVTLHDKYNATTGKYKLKDLTRGKHYVVDMKHTTGSETIFTDTNNVWGNNAESSNETVGADAAYGQNVTWDYFKNVHNRNGIADDGRGARSRVHYANNYDNAFWSDSCFCMTYGDGSFFNPLVSIDVAGHEMTHGVTSRTAGLIYSGESGGLNEGTSDIFGSMAEYYANNANDPGDYLIGEKLSNPPLRNMINPSSDGVSADCWYSGVGNIDVHYSSGVANHFFFLLAEGTSNGSPSKTCVAGNTRVATGNGSVNGIGREKAGKIWYRALATYMTASETFAKARLDTVKAATDLYGAGSAEVAAVHAAWTAVNRP
ncbi:MAG TPA: M4 family metallopeptidase [Ideonella sp.]|uniref:M4 family metallopeptidase n=1 Tax=Ideonella sp. TaxID=1929293 RepID=UPI002E357F0C|nr:M4 family metallopeptidase [Ideonella sp.]HEX5687631.1 M4 family metallopeptidase [Ideonella sp.]